jgi:transcription antitermination factor NusG
MTNTSTLSWFVTTVRPQHEAAVAKWLEERALEPFSPSYSVVRQWSDRKKTLEQPVFPGYVFCRFAREDRAKVLNTPGVRSIIGFGGQPAVVPDSEMERLSAMVASGCLLRPYPYLDKGDSVRIEQGPLRGVEGIVVETQDGCHLVVSITLLSRSVSVRFDMADVVREANPISRGAAASTGN